MLSSYLSAAQAGKSVWLDDVDRSALGEPAIFDLTRFDGSRKLLTRRFECASTAEEQRFVQSHFDACLYNLLSSVGGTALTVWTDLDLLRPAAFAPAHNGYGKVISELDRICAFLGKPPFSITVRPLGEFVAPEADEAPSPELPLVEHLRATAAGAEDKLLCGMDVGGTDIKLALSVHGKLVCTKEYDWNPAAFSWARELTGPIVLLARLMAVCAAAYLRSGSFDDDLLLALRKETDEETMERIVSAAEERYGRLVLDGIGLSFPDVVLHDTIIGGETPKTLGMRNNPEADYEAEFAQIIALTDTLRAFARRVRVTNDGNIAAYTTSMELAHSDKSKLVRDGVIAHSLGTDLGTGWVNERGEIPSMVLELYDTLQDLGSWPKREYPLDDLRGVRNENSSLPGLRRYLGQAGVFRMAYEMDPALIADFVEERDGVLQIKMQPQDLRKPCLEHLMQLAEQGVCEELFREVGRGLAHTSREMEQYLDPKTKNRFLFGRFVKHKRCFELICEGFAEVMPELTLFAADNDLACTPLMCALAAREDVTVAQFGQAIGSIYFALEEEDKHA